MTQGRLRCARRRHRWRASVGVWLSIALAATPARTVSSARADRGDTVRAAQPSFCDRVNAILPDQFPAWSDSANWDDPSQYSTIQLADIDGDGAEELLGRGAGGMVTSKFDVATGQWVTLDSSGPFGGAGWERAAQYSTIKFGDIDGDGREEMIGRGSTGIETYRWNAVDRDWIRLDPSGSGVMPDSDGWADRDAYSTIMLADFHPGWVGLELFGAHYSDPDRLYVLWRWDGGKWAYQDSSFQGASRLTPGEYLTFQSATVNDGTGGAQLIARGSAGMYSALFVDDPSNGTGFYQFATGPWWADRFNSDYPDRYLTIQAADVDGDGYDELLGRAPQDEGVDIGVTVYRYEGGGWEENSLHPGFRNVDGWDQPQYYRTIQTADIDGDGQAELLWRGPVGLYVSHYTKNPSGTHGTWSTAEHPAIPDLSDANGYNQPQHYLTIQGGDIDGDGRDEIIAKSATGIRTWKSTTPAPALQPTFTPVVATPGFPDYSSDPKTDAAYRWIGQNEFEGLTTDDIRGQYANTAYKDRWVLAAKSLQDKLAANQTPPGLDPEAFATVAKQLATEFSYVDLTNVWFGNTNELLDRIFAGDTVSVDIVANLMSLPVEGNNQEATLTILEIVAEVFSGMASLVAFPAAEVAGPVAGLIGVAFSGALAASNEPVSIQAKVAELEQQLEHHNKAAQQANSCQQGSFVGSWGRLKALGELVSSNRLEWTDTTTAALVGPALTTYEIELFKVLGNIKWTTIGPFPDGSAGECEGLRRVGFAPAALDSDAWTFAPPPPLDPLKLWYARSEWTDRWAGHVSSGGPVIFIVDGDCDVAPPAEALQTLFLDPILKVGALGVPFEDAYCGNNGWLIPGSGNINPHCEHPWGSETDVAAMKAKSGVALARTRALIRSVKAGVKSNRVERKLVASLRGAIPSLIRARRGEGAAHADRAASALRTFVLQAQAHAGHEERVRAARRHIARAHGILGLLAPAELPTTQR